ncbi:dTDP-4-dehydrorhamnose 3,5-epimerase [Desulfatibacillum aliphaticivorans]|uniref:dTDP-4-dehydrorhamnose 3,5-epimerase n=1 Tax=Desulfatibacillum aliphaticivorans TaxID=218208 RepID=UPI000408EA06|nr:dTDP-4-dehydrorhamnose 3,5-epimerase [Desulfatibacillum aliphaticivorans]
MKIQETSLPGVLIVEPSVFSDHRGLFMETYHSDRFAAHGLDVKFVQDNLSLSGENVLRGLHYQIKHVQTKLVQAVQGRIFDVAVDVRKGSPSFGQWTGAVLDDESHRQMFIPAGFAHGFCVLSKEARVCYKCDALYAPGDEGTLLWSDPDVGVEWPLSDPILSEKDQAGPRLKDIPPNRLPVYK